jgi:hypothetical protein
MHTLALRLTTMFLKNIVLNLNDNCLHLLFQNVDIDLKKWVYLRMKFVNIIIIQIFTCQLIGGKLQGRERHI